MSNLAAIEEGHANLPGDLRFGWLPMHHVMGLVCFVLDPIYLGAPCILTSPLMFLQRPISWLEAISEHHAAMSAAPSFAYELCTRYSTAEQRARLDLSHWRLAVCGADVVRPNVLEAFAEAFAPAGFDPSVFWPAYGIAEATSMVASRLGLLAREFDAMTLAQGRVAPPSPPAPTRRLVCCGPPITGCRAAIVDPTSKKRLPAGAVGEIWLQGDSVAAGYWGRPEETVEVFRALIDGEERDGHWLRTGDLGFLEPEGLYVAGRLKDLIIVRGVNYDPYDLETRASASALGLATAAAAFTFDEDSGDQIVLVQEVAREAVTQMDFASTTRAVAAALSRDFGLKLYDLVFVKPGSLPLTTSGKVQRQECRRQYLSGELERLDHARHPELVRWRESREKGGDD
jgi:acyl-CoA synthetase (AMP-forming)/AMP-acid ligase II